MLFSALFTFGLDTVPPDGPYLFYEGDTVTAQWADTELRTVGKTIFDPEHFACMPHFPTFRPEMVDVGRDFQRLTKVHYEGVDKVAALSDIHGQFDAGRQLLEANGVIDENLHWSFGDGHLVIVGDIFDRGDQVTELLWLIHNLEMEAVAAGGKVHFLLGNHETLTLEGDDRYLHAKYRTTAGLTGKFYRELYGPDSYLGRWLRSLPLVVEINNTVYIHGGLSRKMVREVSSIDRINEIYHSRLIDAEDISEVKQNNRRLQMLHGAEGPLWYRGYFTRDGFDERDLEYVLRRIGANRIVVGHTSFTAIHAYYDSRLIAVDSSIKFGGVGEILLYDDGDYFRGTIHGDRIPLVATTK
ncbi:calcineurin-like phosphoesterase family protein [Neolewinella xylanilytica]|uniref:Calcineurin-like phosphoesterase family protein n=1 Tax=Neolewinella xylanilytica TaxID=1514080 RepID=A0A2S6I5A9_9BACT|nr:calcineurin-like phosphoesterase family protein [Neolewinella xylanilytica]